MIYHRRSHRLRGYDYSRPGAYFLTLKTFQSQHLFGTIRAGEMVLNEYGRIVRRCWHAIPDHFPLVHLDAFVIMPDHLHGIVWIADDDYVGFDVSLGPDQFSGNAAVDAEHVGAKNFSPLHVPQFVRSNTTIIGPHDPPPYIPTRNPARFSWIEDLPSDAAPFRSPSRTIGSIVRGFKVGVTKELRWKEGIYPVWQRDYWDRIICSNVGLWKVRRYILENPERWTGS